MKVIEKLEPWVKLSLLGLGICGVGTLIALLACVEPTLAGLVFAAVLVYFA